MKKMKVKKGVLYFLLLLLPSLANTHNRTVSFDKKWTAATYAYVQKTLPQINIPFPAEYDEEVVNWVRLYMTRGSRSFEKTLGKFPYYFPIFEAALREKGLPEELKYLSVVESGLIPDIESPVGASGLWQFMPNTAAFFDLTIDEWIDERCDPHRSSLAAANMLHFLYDQFEDWQLVLAAYNCGPGRVRKAIKRTGSRDYKAIRHLLPLQTRNYLVKYTAVAFVATHHHLLGLQPYKDQAGYPEFSVMTVYDWMSLETISEATGIELAAIKKLNPSYKKGILPKNERGNFLVLPGVAALAFEQFLREQGVENFHYHSGEPERIAPPQTDPLQYWASAHVRPLPAKGLLSFNLQGFLSWTYQWGLSVSWSSIFF